MMGYNPQETPWVMPEGALFLVYLAKNQSMWNTILITYIWEMQAACKKNQGWNFTLGCFIMELTGEFEMAHGTSETI